MSITPSPSLLSATQHGSGSLVSKDGPEFAKVRIEDVDDTVPPEFTIPSTLESMRDGFNGEDLPQGRPTARVSDVLTPAQRSNVMDFLSNQISRDKRICPLLLLLSQDPSHLFKRVWAKRPTFTE
jgi:hypothetical protein